ncbi:MAG: hypothetical protein WA851_20965 [Xanthobacteraceae bacterium]
MGGGKFRIKFDGLAIRDRRFSRFPIVAQRRAEVGVSIGKVGLDTNGLAVGPNSFVEPATFVKHSAEIKMKHRFFRFELNCLSKRGNSFRNLALRSQRYAMIGMSVGI